MTSEASSNMDSSTGAHIGSTQRPTAKYSKLTNSLRVLTTGSMQCSMFCGGKGCKYDNPSKWSEDQMAIKGLFSHWVTKRILAMSRPSTEAVKKYDIINQFKEHGIKAVINLQTKGEHAHCGLGLEPGGFSYDQEEFMENDIFFYNFGWDDYGVKSLTFILDMVKVMTFAVKEGKVGVHCHAGLGRTGVLIACYLIYAKRFDGDHAIHFVREKRPGSIQTKGQVECCQQFAQFLIPLRVVFSLCDPCSFPFTLQQFINRQKHLLHGAESREMKHIPKIIKIVCVRLHQLANIRDVHSTCSLGRSDSSDTLKKFTPGVFKDTRRSTEENLLKEEKERRRLSLQLLSDNNGLSASAAEAYSTVPPGRKSPNLDLRKLHLNDGSTVSSSEDDAMSIGKAQRLKTSHSEDSLGASHLSRLRISASLLNNPSLMNMQEDGDVEMVADAMGFDTRGRGEDGDDDEEEDEQEDVGEEGGVAAALRNLKQRVESLQHNLNQSQSAWKIVATEEDPFVLAALMWSWLEHLKEPVLQGKDVEKLVEYSGDLLKSLNLLEKYQKLTLDCLLKTIAGLRPVSNDVEERLVHRFIAAITHRHHQHDNKDLLQFVNGYISALRSTMPSVKARGNANPSSSSKPPEMKDFVPEKKKVAMEEKKKAKGKKKKEKSPRREEVVVKKREKENDQGSSDDEEPFKITVPKKRGSALPPIF
ncbi:protein tyrosine phosphatase domain-containing protein 1 [Strongylocentrotus purpuratus]|uniref:Protein tyrosine phosphatase domain-containing protein 1 n=1 Tax=Strongylocentrotus purpuratus TaxID=7668 RepID=A0A7M7GGE0_STRPU|nr:protein tyrosine phosphatase domain-containing protein 1 [Strongylocentrotus purpuratus]|eukprot:XP_003725586.1 PREDICTED: protein tyrosine phosphatase domain-containing protein 1 [Strongylocentrotus purpuratus]